MRSLARIGAITAGTLVLLVVPAGATPSNQIGVDTSIVTRSVGGGFANGPSSHPVISLDARFATMIAFQSTATDLVDPSTPTTSNVFFVARAQPFDDTGSPWVGGPVELASRGLHGEPADGPSTLPAMSGDNGHAPACVAFISSADNLVTGDTNHRPDAFAFLPASGATIRVSLGNARKQADGAATGVAVNGRCTKFAFADDAANLGAHGQRQIFLRTLQRKLTITVTVKRHGRRVRKRKTVIRPATDLLSKFRGHPGNGPSSDPVFAPASDDVAFTSRATNLGAASGGFSQVYGTGPRLGPLRLLSAATGGAPGDGDSDQPSLSQSAKAWAFRTRAANLGSPGPAQVVYSRPGVPLRDAGPPASADQSDPSVVNQGHYVVFENGPETDLWTDVTSQIVLLSRDSQQRPLTQPTFDPASSEVSNYALFATSDPSADRDFAAAQPAGQGPPAQQIYLRYFGGAR